MGAVAVGLGGGDVEDGGSAMAAARTAVPSWSNATATAIRNTRSSQHGCDHTGGGEHPVGAARMARNKAQRVEDHPAGR